MEEPHDKAEDKNAEKITNTVEEQPGKESQLGGKATEGTLHQWDGKTISSFLKRSLADSMQKKTYRGSCRRTWDGETQPSRVTESTPYKKEE